MTLAYHEAEKIQLASNATISHYLGVQRFDAALKKTEETEQRRRFDAALKG